MALVEGTRLGPYEILSPIGAGRTGEVYLTEDTRLGRQVALKVLRFSFECGTDVSSVPGRRRDVCATSG
jgi:hypothetical protein